MSEIQIPSNGIAVLMMLKNENHYKYGAGDEKPKYTMLEENLIRLKSLVEEVYIVDNASTDGSRQVYERYQKEGNVRYVQYNPPDWKFDDVRDRNILLRVANKREMKWVLIVDGDEIFEDRATKWINDFVSTHNHEDCHIVKFHYVNFWRSRKQFRSDAWNRSWFNRLFSIKNLVLEGQELHNYLFMHRNGSSIVTEAPVKVLHYGWCDWKLFLEKVDRYIKKEVEMGVSYNEAVMKYRSAIDETNIQYEPGDPLWSAEFRKGI